MRVKVKVAGLVVALAAARCRADEPARAEALWEGWPGPVAVWQQPDRVLGGAGVVWADPMVIARAGERVVLYCGVRSSKAGGATVYAFDITGGATLGAFPREELWNVGTGSDVTSLITGDEMIVAATLDGRVIAYEAGTGKERWAYRAVTLPLGQIAGRSGPSVGRPVIAGGRVIVATAATTCVALDATTGKVAWENQRERPEGIFGGPVVDGEAILLGTARRLERLDLVSGKAVALLDRMTYEPVAEGGRIFAWTHGDGWEMAALDARTAERLWTAVAKPRERGNIPAAPLETVLKNEAENPRVHDVVPPVLVRGGLFWSDDTVLNCADAATGKVRWTWEGPPVAGATDKVGAYAPVVSAPAFGGDVAVVVTRAGVFGLDVGTGATRWEFHPAGVERIMGRPEVIVRDGVAYFYVRATPERQRFSGGERGQMIREVLPTPTVYALPLTVRGK